MSQLDVVIFGSLSRPMGPAGTMRRILKNKEYFDSRGYHMSIFSSDGLVLNYDMVQKMHTDSTPIFREGIIYSMKRHIRNRVKGNFLLSLLFFRRDVLNQYSVVKQYLKLDRTPAIISFHSIDSCYYFLKHNKKAVKVVLFFHSDAIPFKMISYNYPKLEGTNINKWHNKVIEYCIERVDKCVFISQIGMNNFKNFYPFIPIDKLFLVINGIEDFTENEKAYLNEFKPTKRPLHRLCCVGTINGRKGQQLICEALAMVDKTSLSNIHVTFIGDGSEKNNLINYCNEHGIASNVSFVGTVPNSDVYKYLANSSIYILMSYNEGLPISIIEAMRAGLPIISTNISGIPELIHTEGDNVNGILLNPNTEKLIYVLNSLDNYDWKIMGKNSRKRYNSDYTFTRMREEYCNMVDSITK